MLAGDPDLEPGPRGVRLYGRRGEASALPLPPARHPRQREEGQIILQKNRKIDKKGLFLLKTPILRPIIIPFYCKILNSDVRTRCRGDTIPAPDLDKWREDPDLRPQQFSASSLHPDLMYKSGFAGEVPDSPMFPHIFDSEPGHDKELKFVPEEGEGLEDVLRQPPIGENNMIMIRMMMMMTGLESNVAYNDHELPSQLSPDQYFKLEWALSEDRQELKHEETGEL